VCRHVDDFKEFGIDRLVWCRELGAEMAASHPDERWYWRGYTDRASPVPLTSFSADVYTEKDLLGIDRTVDALALLMASTRTDTPLSIGIFGPWGSGKSFFMRHLRRKIWGLAEREQNRVAAWIEKRGNRPATRDDAPLYYGQVAQVEFNAWHYNEGNLVASLVDHLFRNLRVLPEGKDKELEERRASVLVQISAVEGKVVEALRSSTARAAGRAQFRQRCRGLAHVRIASGVAARSSGPRAVPRRAARGLVHQLVHRRMGDRLKDFQDWLPETTRYLFHRDD
jgi:hypothetical protein